MLAFFETLKYLLLGGRISKAKVLLGSVLNVKPVITMRDGVLRPAGLVRTRSKGIERLFELGRSTLNVEEMAIVHSSTPDEASSLKERIASVFDKKLIHIARLGPGLGVHGGPGTLILTLRQKGGSISQDAGEGRPSRKRFSLPPLHIPKLNFSSP